VVEGWQLLLDPKPMEVGPIQIVFETAPADSTPGFYEQAAELLQAAEG